MQLYREWEGKGVKDRRIQGFYHQGGRCLLLGSPPPSPKLPSNTRRIGWAEQDPKCQGRLVGQSKGQPTRNWLEPVGRWTDSEGSLLLSVTSNLDVERNRRGGKIIGGKERTGEGSGVGYRLLLEEGGGGLNWKTTRSGTTSTDTK